MLKRLALAFAWFAACAVAHAQQVYVPSVKIGTAALISPSAAETYYGSSSTATV